MVSSSAEIRCRGPGDLFGFRPGAGYIDKMPVSLWTHQLSDLILFGSCALILGQWAPIQVLTAPRGSITGLHHTIEGIGKMRMRATTAAIQPGTTGNFPSGNVSLAIPFVLLVDMGKSPAFLVAGRD